MSIFGTPKSPEDAEKILNNSKKLFDKKIFKEEYIAVLSEHLSDPEGVWTEELLADLKSFLADRAAEYAPETSVETDEASEEVVPAESSQEP